MRSIILHGHIFKNAGTTFDWSLERNFGGAFLDHRDDRAMREQRAAHLAQVVAVTPALRALSSHHLCYPLPKVDQVTFHSVYLLRHPIERIASVYEFERRQQADTRGARAAKELSFRDYVAWRLRDDVPRTIRDYQTCYVAGFHDGGPREFVPPDWLRRALNHLASIACVGVVDRYDESMVAFEHLLAEDFPGIDLAYVKQNVTRRRDSGKGLEVRVRNVLRSLRKDVARVLEKNSLDLALYRQANLKLDATLGTIDNLPDRLADFRERCARLVGASG